MVEVAVKKLGKVWIKDYHTGLAGTTYFIAVTSKYITLRATGKPYRIQIPIPSLQALIETKDELH